MTTPPARDALYDALLSMQTRAEMDAFLADLCTPAELRAFAEHHLATEQNHLRLISGWLPESQYSRLLPLWRLAGFLTGALPALFGPKAVYATIEAVETFVDHHYEEQILALARQIEFRHLRQTLLDCQADEVAHRDEAAAAAKGLSHSGWMLRAWCAMVGAGSKAAVTLIRHI